MEVETIHGKAKTRKSFLLRIDPVLYEELESWAQQECRSVNRQIEYLLEEAARRREETRRALNLQDGG